MQTTQAQPTPEHIEAVVEYRDYIVHLSDGHTSRVYMAPTTWGEVWYQQGTTNYLHVKTDTRTAHGDCSLITFVLDTIRCTQPTTARQPEPETIESPVEVAAPVKVKRTSNAPQPIRRCVAICREFGCNFRNEEARRDAASKVLGRPLRSCADMTLPEWGRFGNAIKFEGVRF